MQHNDLGIVSIHGNKRIRPDLRSSGHFRKGTRGVRIEFEIPDDQVLLSDFESWHYVLNYWYLARSEAEDKAFDRYIALKGFDYFITRPLPEPYHNQLVATWLRIFDLDWADDYVASPREQKSIQAVFWELRLDHVKNVDFFVSR